MAIKSKNNPVPYASHIFSLYLLGFALLCAVDLYTHQHFFSRLMELPWTIQSDLDYYAAIRSRLIKELILGIAAFGGGAYLYWRQRKEQRPALLAFTWLRRNPIDVRLFLLFALGFLLFFIGQGNFIFYLPLGIKHVLVLTVTAYLTGAFLSLGESLLPLFSNDSSRTDEWQSSLIRRHFRLYRSGLKEGRMIFAFTLILGGTGIVGVIIGSFTSSSMFFEAFITLLLLYSLVAFPAVLYILGAFHQIRNGAKEMAQGNLNRQLDEKDCGPFASLANSINNMKEGYLKALEEQVKSERMKTELITNVSHDLKTPLTSIVNYVDLLGKPGLDQETKEKYLEVLTQKTDRLKLLIDDLFEASKMASGAVELQMEKIDVAALLEQALAEFSDKIASSSLTFRVKGADRHVFAMLDGRKTWRVFENLIGNALKYAQPGTRVYLQLEATEGSIHFTMKNVSAYEIDFEADELMERFKRGDASRSTEGSGLGLAIARSIVELQGGSFRIDLDGDVFKVQIHLPRTRLPLEVDI